jgi:hypothetical protein
MNMRALVGWRRGADGEEAGICGLKPHHLTRHSRPNQCDCITQAAGSRG